MPSGYDKALPPEAKPRWQHSVVLELLGGDGPPWLGPLTVRVWRDAEVSLRRRGRGKPSWEDIASEALEAAEALGL